MIKILIIDMKIKNLLDVVRPSIIPIQHDRLFISHLKTQPHFLGDLIFRYRQPLLDERPVVIL